MGKRKNAVAPSQNFVVEKVLDHYIDELGNKWFYLKWMGYPEEQATWEPESNVDCTGLIKEFEKRLSKKSSARPPAAAQWSLKQDTGSSTKIVLKKVNLGKGGQCARDATNLKINGDHEPSETLPQRKNKRRRSSTIGTEVGTPKKKRTGGRRKNKESEEALAQVAAGSSEEYMVEAILDKCLDANGRILYHIKWIGYDHINNTWEPVENLNCPQILHEFNLTNKLPKVIVSKILDKRKVDGRTEYLAKISGCRKETWMREKELHCTDLLNEFNKAYNAKHSKVSLADIADDCSSSEADNEPEPKPKSVIPRGIKINKDCTTSSDDDDFSPLLHKKKPPLPNGKHSKTRTSHSSNSSSSDSNIDFEALLKRCNDSAPPSPPSEMVPSVSPPKEKVDISKSEPFAETKLLSPVIAPKTPVNNINQTDSKTPEEKPIIKSPPKTLSDSDSDNNDNDDPLASIRVAKFDLPQLIIPKDERLIPRKPIPAAPSPSPPPPVFNYPGTLTCDRSKDPSREIVKTETRVRPPSSKAPLASYMKPMRSASDDSDSDESLSDLENKLTEALQGSEPGPSQTNPQPPIPEPTSEQASETGFTGVDLGALIFTETEKPADCSLNMSGLLDSIVSQTVTNSLQSAFMDTSVLSEKDQSHSELFAVVAQHSVQSNGDSHPSEKEIDSVLSELYETAYGTDQKEAPNPSIKSENKTYFDEPHLNEYDDDEVEPLDPPLNNIVGAGDDVSPPRSPVCSSALAEPPFTALQGILSTFSKPTKKLPKKTVLSVKTFSKKTPVTTKVKPISKPEEDIFSNLGCITVKSKRTFASNSVPCTYCSRKFKDKSKLDFHISFKHPQMLEMTCDGCNEYFQSAIEYQCHQLSCGQGE